MSERFFTSDLNSFRFVTLPPPRQDSEHGGKRSRNLPSPPQVKSMLTHAAKNAPAQQPPPQENEQPDPELVKKAAAEFLRELTEGWKKESQGAEQAQGKALPEQKPQPDRPDDETLRKIAKEFGELLQKEWEKRNADQKQQQPKSLVGWRNGLPIVAQKNFLGAIQTKAGFTGIRESNGVKRRYENGVQVPMNQEGPAQQQTAKQPDQPASKVAKITAMAAKIPGKVAGKAKTFISNLYTKLEGRYGKAVAIAAVGLAIAGLPLPVPGSSVIMMAPVVAAAELYRQVSGGGKAEIPAGAVESTDPKTAGRKIIDAAKGMAKLSAEVAVKARDAVKSAFSAIETKYGQAAANLALGIHCAHEILHPIEQIAHHVPALSPTSGGMGAPVMAACELWEMIHHKLGGHKEKPVFAPPPEGESLTQPPDGIEPYAPDVVAIDPKTGVAKHALVGVPAMESPPPPKEIPRLPNLTKKERKAETTFANDYLDHPDEMVNEYLQLLKLGPKNGGIGDAPNIFGTDDAKVLSRHYRGEGGTPEEKLAAKGIYNAAVHQTANAIAKRAFTKYLDSLPEDKKSVLVTSGGVASGKGYSLANVPETKALVGSVGAVWDAAGEQNATENPWVLEECRKRGIKAIFAYVHADPKNTWENPQRGVVERAGKIGRMVSAKNFADSYALGAENFKGFHDKNRDADDVEFVFIDGSGKDGPKRADAMPDAALKVDRDKLYAESTKVLEDRKGAVKDYVYRGGSIGSRIWGVPKDETGHGHKSMGAWRTKGSYFAECERDETGHCLPSGQAGNEGDAENKPDKKETDESRPLPTPPNVPPRQESQPAEDQHPNEYNPDASPFGDDVDADDRKEIVTGELETIGGKLAEGFQMAADIFGDAIIDNAFRTSDATDEQKIAAVTKAAETTKEAYAEAAGTQASNALVLLDGKYGVDSEDFDELQQKLTGYLTFGVNKAVDNFVKTFKKFTALEAIGEDDRTAQQARNYNSFWEQLEEAGAELESFVEDAVDTLKSTALEDWLPDFEDALSEDDETEGGEKALRAGFFRV